MRASPKHFVIVTSALIAVSGCSSGQDWWKLSRKSQTGFSNLASAPAAVEQPALPSTAATAASGSGSNVSQTGYGTASGTAARTGRYPEGPAGTTAANARGLDKYSGLEKSGGTQAPPFTGARGGYPPASTSTASAAATDYNNAVTGGGRYGTATATPDSAYTLPPVRTADSRNDYRRTPPTADPYSLPANPPASYGASNSAAAPTDTAAGDGGYRAEPARSATDRYGRYGQDSGSSDRYAQDEPSYDVSRRPAGNPVGTASYNTAASDASAPLASGYRPGSTRTNPPSYSDTGAGAAYPNSHPATAGYSSGSTLPSGGAGYESTTGGAAYSRSSPPVVAKQPTTTSGDGLNSSARGSVIDPDYRADANSRYPATGSPATNPPISYPGTGSAAGATSGGYPATSSPASGYPATSGYPSTSNYPTTGGYPATNNGYNGPSSNATLTR